MMNTMGPSFGNTQHRPPWMRPNRPRQFQQWNPRFNQPSFSQGTCEEFWCETCDRGFPRKDILEKHKQQHQKCNIDGCQFIAHPKVITKHIQMQHSTGLFKKIAVLNNPEEIKKWIEERKKKYPTKENVEKKDAETKEKIDRGEKMGMKHNKRFDDKRKFDNLKRKHPQNNNCRDNQAKKKPRQRKTDNVLPSTADNKKLKPFLGIQSLLLEEEEEIEDVNVNNDLIEDTDNIDNDPKTTDINPTICGALSSLICDYGSSDEDCHESTISDTTLTASFKESKDQNKSKPNKIVVMNSNETIDEDSGPEEVKAVVLNAKDDMNLTDPAPSKSVVDKKNSKTSRLGSSKKVTLNRRPRSKLPSTLLQKLLRNEIKQERNQVLQCIRYIVEHNYFDET